jgi:hypothetical protein
MSNLGGKSLRKGTTMTLDPPLDLVILVWRKVVSVTENDIPKCPFLAHDEVTMQL